MSFRGRGGGGGRGFGGGRKLKMFYFCDLSSSLLFI